MDYVTIVFIILLKQVSTTTKSEEYEKKNNVIKVSGNIRTGIKKILIDITFKTLKTRVDCKVSTRKRVPQRRCAGE